MESSDSCQAVACQSNSIAINLQDSLRSLRDWRTFQSCFSITYTVEAWPFLSLKDFFPLTATSYSLDLSYRTYIEYKTCVSWNTWFLTGALFHTYPKGGCRKLGYERPWEDNLWASTLSLMHSVNILAVKRAGFTCVPGSTVVPL